MIKDTERDINVVYRILKYCKDVEKAISHFENSFDKFKNDVVFINAVSMPIMQIGELSKHLSDEFKSSHSDIPWSVIRGMRNFLAHDYYAVDIEVVWKTAVGDIPSLAEFCEKVISDKE